MQPVENHIVEGQIFHVHNFVVGQYQEMQLGRCFEQDIYIQFTNMTQVFMTEGLAFIPHHVFDFTDFSALRDAADEPRYLIGQPHFLCLHLYYSIACINNYLNAYVDVVGVLDQAQPITHFRNSRRQHQSFIEFTITDMQLVFTF